MKRRRSSSSSVPTAPDRLPEEEILLGRAHSRRRSRYDRPRSYVSWWGGILGLLLGIGVGLYYTWYIAPVREKDVAPWQLREDQRDEYLVAILLDYHYNGDLNRAINRLTDLHLPGGDPIQAVAEIACGLASSDYVGTNSGLRAVRSMIYFYRQQNRSGCADSLLVSDDVLTTTPGLVILASPTPLPPITKTPTPPSTGQATPTSIRPYVPTSPPTRAYEWVVTNTFCDATIPGVIEVRVRNYAGEETPGLPIRVRWSDGQSLFFTGLKPERGPGYADFVMEAGLNYIVEMPGLSDPIPEPLLADECYTETGVASIISYRLIFQGE